MTFTASELIRRARSLADLQNTQFISHSDEIDLINEAYRDIYSRYTESDGDYWANELIIDIDSTMQDPNNQFGYLIPLPADFLKIRTLSYNNGGLWVPCQKFSMSNRDNNPSQPMYRLKNGNLWVIGNPSSYTQLKLNYYPIESKLSAPQDPINILAGEAIYDYPNVLSIYYDTDNKIAFYIIGLSIKCYNVNTGVTSTIYTATNAIVNIYYLAGWVYWIESGRIYRAKTDFTSTITKVMIVGIGITYFTLQNNRIYYTFYVDIANNGTKYCNLDGSSDTLLHSSVYSKIKIFQTSTELSIVGGYIAINGVSTNVLCDKFVVDDDYIYVLYNTIMFRYSFDGVGLVYVDQVTIDTTMIGENSNGEYLPVITYNTVEAISLIPDIIIDYPANEVNEIMAYSSAIGYARKQADQVKIGLLAARLTELWERFWSVNKRDEYQFTRINNDYQNGGNSYNW
jgi:hypothetical protein